MQKLIAMNQTKQYFKVLKFNKNYKSIITVKILYNLNNMENIYGFIMYSKTLK